MIKSLVSWVENKKTHHQTWVKWFSSLLQVQSCISCCYCDTPESPSEGLSIECWYCRTQSLCVIYWLCCCNFHPFLCKISNVVSDSYLKHHDLYSQNLLFHFCSSPSSSRSQGILHSFSGTETDRIWPYINSLLSNKIHTLPLDAHQTQTPWHSFKCKDHEEKMGWWEMH